MHRGRTVAAYAIVGIGILSITTASTGSYLIEGPGPLAFDATLAAGIVGYLCVLAAGVFALGVEPDWAITADAE